MTAPLPVDATMYGIPVKFYPATNAVIPAHWILLGPLLLCLHTHTAINTICGTDYPFPIKLRNPR